MAHSDKKRLAGKVAIITEGRFGIRCNMIRPRATVNTGGGA